ncbi:hypothetical protein D3C83_315880 [compost metagenome]
MIRMPKIYEGDRVLVWLPAGPVIGEVEACDGSTATVLIGVKRHNLPVRELQKAGP